jgi:hypothetical protein
MPQQDCVYPNMTLHHPWCYTMVLQSAGIDIESLHPTTWLSAPIERSPVLDVQDKGLRTNKRHHGLACT